MGVKSHFSNPRIVCPLPNTCRVTNTDVLKGRDVNGHTACSGGYRVMPLLVLSALVGSGSSAAACSNHSTSRHTWLLHCIHAVNGSFCRRTSLNAAHAFFKNVGFFM